MKIHAFLAALLAAAPALSAPICDGAVTDRSRDRSIPVRVRMPESGLLSAGGRAPVILFSHGLGGSVDAGTLFAREWAKAGFLVVHVQHPGSDQSVWQGKRGGIAALKAAAGGQQLADRVADMAQVADAVGASARVGACDLGLGDPARMGAAGHSFGAHTVLALAGQRFGPRGPAGRDARFRAVAALSPMPPGMDAAMAPAAFGAIEVPVLAATGSADGSPLAKDKTLQQVVSARASVFPALKPSQTGKGHVGLWLEGATHADFGGNATPRKSPDAHVGAVTTAATTAFFRAHLSGNGRPDMSAARALLRPGDRIDQK
jgi:predicted dienelactone hydrolase